MDELPFQRLANKVWEKELLSYFTKEKAPTSNEKLNAYWEIHSKDLNANSYCYLFSYKRHHIMRAKGLEIIGIYNDEENILTEVNEYLEHIIEEQRYLLAFIIRRAAVDLFIEHSLFFSSHQDEYIFYTDITIKDSKGKFWHAQQMYTPLFLDNDDADMPYFCKVELVEQTSKVPFMYRLDHINKEGDQKKVLQLNEEFRSTASKYIIRELGLTNKPLEYFNLYLVGLKPKDVMRKFGHSSLSAQDNARNRTYHILREKFRVLIPNHEPLELNSVGQILYDMGLVYSEP